jgi:hypothetical protein
MRNKLVPEKMSYRQLWGRAYVLIDYATPSVSTSPRGQKLALDQLKTVLKEIELRGEQYQLFPTAIPGPPDETARGIGGHGAR